MTYDIWYVWHIWVNAPSNIQLRMTYEIQIHIVYAKYAALVMTYDRLWSLLWFYSQVSLVHLSTQSWGLSPQHVPTPCPESKQSGLLSSNSRWSQVPIWQTSPSWTGWRALSQGPNAGSGCPKQFQTRAKEWRHCRCRCNTTESPSPTVGLHWCSELICPVGSLRDVCNVMGQWASQPLSVTITITSLV